MHFRSAGLLFVWFAAATAVHAETVQCTEITSLPYSIQAPGVYCLKRSLTFTEPNGFGGRYAIGIAVDDVVVDLNGYVLAENAPGGRNLAIGAGNRKNVTVRNGTIRGFRDGVTLEDYPHGAPAEGYVVENLRVEHCRWNGIVVRGRGSVVRDNDVRFTGGFPNVPANGILVGGSGASVTDNRVLNTVASEPGEGTGNTATGIQVLWGRTILEPAVGAIVERNFVANDALAPTSSYGIQFNGAKGNAVGNRVVNMRYGIWFSGQGMYMDNIVAGAVTPYGGWGIAAGTTNFSY